MTLYYVMAAALVSMGTEISEEDVGNISALCDQVIQLADYRLVTRLVTLGFCSLYLLMHAW